MLNKIVVGSYTAKGGFENEVDVVIKFNNYKKDVAAQKWLFAMGYSHEKINKLIATRIPPRIKTDSAIKLGVMLENIEETKTFKKADIQVKLEIVIENIYYVENLSLKKANSSAGYNQIDKRPVDKYKSFWNIPDRVCETLKYFTGELITTSVGLKDNRRMYLDEIEASKVNEVIDFFSENKVLVFNDVLRGRGALSADWVLVTRKNGGIVDWILKDINYVCNFFAQGEVLVTKKGNLKIGKMTMQRKGGTPDPKSLQFKINPLELFESELN